MGWRPTGGAPWKLSLRDHPDLSAGKFRQGVTTLGDRGSVFATNTPNAVTVRPGGALIVEDADLFGLGRVVRQGTRPLPAPGAALVADGATVRIVRGTLSGGNVGVTPDPAGPLPPSGTRGPGFVIPSPSDFVRAGVVGTPFAMSIPRDGFTSLPFSGTPLAPALVAERSIVEIEGGVLVSSRSFGEDELYAAVPAMVVSQSTLRIRGGSFVAGSTLPQPDVPRVLSAILAAPGTPGCDG